MSIKSAAAYVQKLEADSAFARLIKDTKDVESRKKILSSADFDFTKAELDSVVSALSKDRLAALTSRLTDLTSMQITVHS